MLNHTELTKTELKEYDMVRRNKTVETTCTECTNKETNLHVNNSQGSNKYTFNHQTQRVTTNINKHFRNLSDFAVKGKCIDEQKQNMRNVTIEFKTGLEQILTRREKINTPETSKDFIPTNLSYQEQSKNCTKEDKIRKVRALVGFNQCIENIVQELTTRNLNKNFTQKTTDIQTNSKTLQINKKRKTSFDKVKTNILITPTTLIILTK